MTRLHFALLLLVCVSFTEAQTTKVDPKKDKKEELKLTKEEEGVIELTNAERKKADLPPLTANAQLMVAARGHAEYSGPHCLDQKVAILRYCFVRAS